MANGQPPTEACNCTKNELVQVAIPKGITAGELTWMLSSCIARHQASEMWLM
jgi:hypothetical protein